MRLYGHINRSAGLANTIMQGSVDGGGGRGRPKTVWLDNIKKWTGKNVTKLHRASKDRQRWKEITRVASQATPQRPVNLTRDR